MLDACYWIHDAGYSIIDDGGRIWLTEIKGTGFQVFRRGLIGNPAGLRSGRFDRNRGSAKAIND